MSPRGSAGAIRVIEFRHDEEASHQKNKSPLLDGVGVRLVLSVHPCSESADFWDPCEPRLHEDGWRGHKAVWVQCSKSRLSLGVGERGASFDYVDDSLPFCAQRELTRT